MKTLNRVTLIGYVANPELADENSNKPLKFAITTKKKGYTRKDGTVVEDEPMFHNCVCFGKLALTISQYIKKSDLVYVEGEITYNTYTDNNGIVKQQTNIMVYDVSILSHAEDRQNRQQQPQQPYYPNPQGVYQQQMQQPQYVPPVQNTNCPDLGF